MRRLRTMGAVAALAATGSLAAASPALAEDFECRGALGAVTIAGNVIVPDESVCTLNGTQVDGSITVKSRATLDATGIRTTGGIQAASPRNVLLDGSTIGNNVSVVKAGEPVLRRPADSRIQILDNRITGDIALQDNESTISIARNTNSGSIAAEKNRGPVDISANVIGNQLQCQANTPPPTGSGNSARQYGGQCPAPAFGTTRP